MNSGPTSERVYDTLKLRLLGHEFAPGDHLDPASLHGQLGSSVTPVREALYRLAGERLVDMRTSSGFHVPFIDEPGLQDLYDWNAEVLLAAIRLWPAARPRGDDKGSSVGAAVPEVFDGVARRTGNAEVTGAIAGLNDRLSAVRHVEEAVLGGIGIEREDLRDALAREDRQALRSAVTRYHRRRRRSAAAIVRALYRSG